jgi:hypothetical protein
MGQGGDKPVLGLLLLLQRRIRGRQIRIGFAQLLEAYSQAAKK